MTGGAGFIGSHLCAELLRRGHAVHVVDDLSTGRLENLAAINQHPLLRTTVASVADPALAARACAGADIVFHLAGVVGVRRLASEPVDVMQRNLRCTEVIAAAAAAARVPLLSTSSSEVYGDGPVPFREQDPVRPGTTEGLRGGYACAKLMGEWLAFGHAQQTGLPVVVARLFNTVGPRQSGDHGMVLPRFVAQALRGEPITVYGSGEHTRCFAHVEEVARALADLAEAPGAPGCVFNVGSAVETTVGDLALLVRERAGSRSPIVRVPFAEVFPTGFADPPRRLPCLERLARVIGWVPQRPLADIVDELIALARSRTEPDLALTEARCE
ncbi:MAG TPA: NAD-dependent epimerase/dehydratase family protein [Planctomycetota bacterium]